MISVFQQLDGFYWRVDKGDLRYGPLYNTASTEQEAQEQAEAFLKTLD